MAAKRKKASKKGASRKKAVVASDNRNHLDRIPIELFCLVTEKCGLSIRDLISLAFTSRRCYENTIPTVYKKHAKEYFGIAMYWAVKNGRYDTLERLFENGASINLDEELYHLFEKVKKTRAYFEFEDGSNFTPLGWAASLGLDNMVQYLLDRGANIEQPCTAIPACRCSTLLLLEPDDMPAVPQNIDGSCDTNPWTPIHFAICQGHESTTKLLIARGASVTEVNCDSEEHGYEGVTALHVATSHGREDIIDYLLDNKLVDINATGSEGGVTALHIAYAVGDFSLVDKYLDLGADINLVFGGNSDGRDRWNILAMACADERLDLALQYLQRGADPGFIIRTTHDPRPWTAMRFIHEHRRERQGRWVGLSEISERIALEQEIFKASGGKPPTRG